MITTILSVVLALACAGFAYSASLAITAGLADRHNLSLDQHLLAEKHFFSGLVGLVICGLVAASAFEALTR